MVVKIVPVECVRAKNRGIPLVCLARWNFHTIIAVEGVRAEKYQWCV